MSLVQDLNINSIDPLITPEELQKEMPLSDAAANTITEARQVVRDIIDRKDPRLMVVIGP